MGLYPLFSHKHKELRFAILLPFSASSDAENGRLSANFICHAPAPFYHAPGTSPASGHQHVGAYILSSQRAHQSLQCHSAPSWGAENGLLQQPASGLWPAPSRRSYISPTNVLSTFCPFFFFFKSDHHFRTLPSLIFPPCYLLSGHSLNRLEFSRQFLCTVGARF